MSQPCRTGIAGLSRPNEANADASVETLDQLHPFQTGMAVLADDDVVVHGDAERGGNVDDRLGHLNIRLRGRRIAGCAPGLSCCFASERTLRLKWPLSANVGLRGCRSPL